MGLQSPSTNARTARSIADYRDINKRKENKEYQTEDSQRPEVLEAGGRVGVP